MFQTLLPKYFKCSLAILFLMVFFSHEAIAQYEEFRFPQDKEEIAKFRKLKVLYEEKFSKEAGMENDYTIRMFDTFGRVIYSRGPYNHKSYKYNKEGKLIVYIDSAQGGNEYFRSDYEFEYDGPDGRLSFARVSPYSLTFKYNVEKNLLFESTMIDYEQYRQRYFYYDAKGHIREEKWLYPNHTLERIRKMVLNRQGNPTQETLLKYFQNGTTDSSFITYRYDDKGRTLEMKTISSTFSYPVGHDSIPVILPKPETDTTVYRYTYNNYGKSSETYHYSTPDHDHKYEWWYDKNGLIHDESYYKEGVLKFTHNFRYTFYKSPGSVKTNPAGKKHK